MPYDPTRSGAVTEPVFRRGLSDAFRMPFNDDQLDTLSQRYRQEPKKVSKYLQEESRCREPSTVRVILCGFPQ